MPRLAVPRAQQPVQPTPSVFTPRGTPRVVDLSPRSQPAKVLPPSLAPSDVNVLLLEKLELVARGETDCTRRLVESLRTTLDQGGYGPREFDAQVLLGPAGLAAICRRYDIPCDTAAAHGVLLLHGLPVDGSLCLQRFLATFSVAHLKTSRHRRSTTEFPSSPRTSRGAFSSLYRTVTGEGEAESVAHARRLAQAAEHQTPRGEALDMRGVGRALATKLAALAPERDFSRKLQDRPQGHGPQARRRRSGGLPRAAQQPARLQRVHHRPRGPRGPLHAPGRGLR